jgi:cell division protein FtsB
LNKAANIYWGSEHGSLHGSTSTTAQKRRRGVLEKTQERTVPPWLASIIVVSIFVMLCVTINYRAFTEVREEVNQHERLSSQIQNLMDENLALQEEIHTLKSDPNVIGREAKRIGIAVKSSQ